MDLKIVAVITIFLQSFHAEAGGLSYNFYDQSCPQLENIVRAQVQYVSLADPTTPSALLRLLFHDCQVQGCDASILLDGTKYSEMASSKNFGIRKRDFIDFIKSTVEEVCPEQVSCADILVDPPTWWHLVGGMDKTALLPPADIGVDAMLQLFTKKGLSVQESVAILGAHTLGITHCLNLENRAGNSINPGFENTLRLKCPVGSPASKISFVQNDVTSILFDNQYFVNSMNGRGVLKIDAQMPLDYRTRPFVEKFGNDEKAFFQAFSSAFVKLSSSNVLTGNQGVIRRSCNGLMY
ncbi:hypothetical protein DH2020_004357 [Rehmannia glutinosa]|uniref:Peroxidase n=1 Tax=Rehmannia glutinosa TaxID=99300 RepID=A0ABR0XP82_REHGL